MHPERLKHEYQGDLEVGATLESVETLRVQRLKLQHARERLIDSFTESLIVKDQFVSRMDRTKSCIADLIVSASISQRTTHDGTLDRLREPDSSL